MQVFVSSVRKCSFLKTISHFNEHKSNKRRDNDTEQKLQRLWKFPFLFSFVATAQNVKNRAHDVVRRFCRRQSFVSHAFEECDIQLHVSLYVNKISIHKKAPWQSISRIEVLIWKRTMPTSIWSLSGLHGALNECVFPAKACEDRKKKIHGRAKKENRRYWLNTWYHLS